tara:strand:+ start:1465 stop:1719 length:255 start_codon:yes stop_codon:yes gene_type:complete
MSKKRNRGKVGKEQITIMAEEIMHIALESEDDYEAIYAIEEQLEKLLLLDEGARTVQRLRNQYVISDRELQELQSDIEETPEED